MKPTERQREKQRGVALIMVMITLMILSLLTVDFMEDNQVNVETTVAHRDAVQAEYLAKSAVNLSRLLLSVQSLPEMKQAMNFPFWQYAELMLEPFYSSDGSAGLMGDMMGFSLDGVQGLGLREGHEFAVTIVDEESKLNVTQMANPGNPRGKQVLANLGALLEPEIFDSLFDGKDYRDDITREELICEIQDFSDQDEDGCSGAGGEESYYSQLTPSYERKNAPFDSLMELHLVHGIGDDFWNTIVEPNTDDPQSRAITVWGNGAINVNTASTPTLLASLCQLSADSDGISQCTDPYVLMNLIQIIQAYKDQVAWFPVSDVNEFINYVKKPMTLMTVMFAGNANLVGFPITAKSRNIKKMFTTKSQFFSIYAEGIVRNSTKRIHAVIDTNPKQPDILDPSSKLESAGGKILYWRME